MFSSNTITNITWTLQNRDPWRLLKDGNLQESRSTVDGVVHANPQYENYTNMLSPLLREESAVDRRDSLYIVLPITVIYVVIFFTGLIGNISTCVVIARNKSMHTATNYYLFSLAVSDLLLLVFGLPPEMYYIWSHFPYIFGEAFCIIQSFASETSANATVLTITAFTIERYVAICHPFISHTMSKLSRAVKFVIAIWLLALCFAVPQAIQFGIIYSHYNGTVILDSARCSLRWTLIEHAFEISTFLFFVLPMTIITVLYVLIAIKLRHSSLLTTVSSKRHHTPDVLNHVDSNRGKTNAQRNVIRMLVAVVVAFFICWAPFHAQRLLAVYAQSSSEPQDTMVLVYTTLTYVSGVFYYLSTTVNPLLYNIMSNKFREAFKSMLPKYCIRKFSSHKGNRRQPTYSSLSRYHRSMRHRFDDAQHSPSISVSDEHQRLSHIALANANSCELNGLAKFQNEREGRPTTRETVDCRDTRRISRDSDCSQLTTMTSLSKQGLNNEGNNNANECLLRIHRSPKAVTLAGIFTERLGLGTKGFFTQHRKISSNNMTKMTKPKPENVIAMPPPLESHPSIESANTISNSSLQDLDETEFTGSELARYMGELNFELVT
ncbi:neuromedin-U receptor 2-like isoform X1 [Solenopsis invicta]|uniref:neuromedin-U receptor 2-like isoform X1 n=1 Tax=Solenopsis invicta TaxID=13686 RepID=UPI000E340390|nr:neuromedin-U receptor 2-like isoform X1 [Solenopsis invicta]XP_025988374.1 neuromedin-U receptor 2-like isoform X1 [Solenopsis invicta]XP_025988375.1 neuromedin-U receptor 2-like isoform X1 [Solenopsis invicta]XP_039304809.1 neuromedin-U receptor 2-like isoform X1 [Solenopsis invicta]